MTKLALVPDDSVLPSIGVAIVIVLCEDAEPVLPGAIMMGEAGGLQVAAEEELSVAADARPREDALALSCGSQT